MSTLIDSLKTHKTLPNATLFFGEDPQILHKNTLSLSLSLMDITPTPADTPFLGLTQLNTHPDFIFHSSEPSIKVEDITHIQDRLKYGPSQHQRMIIVIDQCHLLTKESANRFLKTIEEPPQNVHFIFLTTSKAKVLPTILSRCNPLYIPSNTEITPPEPYINFSTLKKLPLHDQHKHLEPYLKDKPKLKQLLYSWMNESWSAHPPQEALPLISPIITCLKTLEYNVNVRLQLNALMQYY
tara:strand:- start:2037 stop:2756 length:720 start_codon:yes stop_codon:yes gene_type:complete